MAADYHVSPSGDDAADGLSPERAWRSIARANRHLAEAGLAAGDRLLFAGGAAHETDQALALAPARLRGTAERPVTIASYGSGRARIEAKASSCKDAKLASHPRRARFAAC